MWMIAVWSRVRAAGAFLWGIAARYPFPALCVALALFSAWSWNGWNKSEARRKSDAVAFQQASDKARQAQADLRARETIAYQGKASHANTSHAIARGDSRAATDRYVAARRVRTDGSCSAAQSIGQADPTRLREDVPGESFVAVSEADVQRAAEWQTYAIELRKWAISVSE
jgi:hypothetical protein